MPLQSCLTLESLLSNNPQAVGLPPPVLKAEELLFQTSASPEVARSNSLILESRVVATLPESGSYPLPEGEGRHCLLWARHPLPGCFLCNRGSFLPLTP